MEVSCATLRARVAKLKWYCLYVPVTSAGEPESFCSSNGGNNVLAVYVNND